MLSTFFDIPFGSGIPHILFAADASAYTAVEVRRAGGRHGKRDMTAHPKKESSWCPTTHCFLYHDTGKPVIIRP